MLGFQLSYTLHFAHDHPTLSSPAKIPDAEALRRVDEVLLARIVDFVVSEHGW